MIIHVSNSFLVYFLNHYITNPTTGTKIFVPLRHVIMFTEKEMLCVITKIVLFSSFVLLLVTQLLEVLGRELERIII